jgi:uncharacterized ion transporter superfamily protein YfcC
MALTTRGKVTLAIRLVGLALVIWGVIVLQQTYAATANMRMVAGAIGGVSAHIGMNTGQDAAASAMAAFRPDYMPGVLLAAIGLALCRPLVHALFTGLEERPAPEPR